MSQSPFMIEEDKPQPTVTTIRHDARIIEDTSNETHRCRCAEGC